MRVNFLVDGVEGAQYIPEPLADTDAKALAWLNERYEVVRDTANWMNFDEYDKIQIAPDFQVKSPKIKDNPDEALQEAKDEVLKDNKSIAKLSLTVPKLIEKIEQLEARINTLEK